MVGLAALAVAGVAAATGAGRPLGAETRARPALTPLEAANKLLADPWNGGLRQQYETEAEKGMKTALEGEELAGGGGSVGITYKGVGVTAKWHFGLTTKNVSANLDLAAPPGFRSASLNGFTMDVPRGGFWNFALASDVDGSAWLKVAGNKIFTWSPSLFRFGFRVSNFRLSTNVQLNSAQPDRPVLVRAVVTPQFTVGGAGFLPVAMPVTFNVTVAGGKVSLSGRVANLNLSVPGLDARLTGDIVLTLLPSYYTEDLELDMRQRVFGTGQGDAINLRAAFQRADLAFRGSMSVGLKYGARVSVPYSMTVPILVPSSDEVNQALLFLQPPLPKSWAEDRPAPSGAVPDGSVFEAPAHEIEGAVVKHLPHGAVLALDFLQRGGTLLPGAYTYAAGADSAIWTGHYLAAEAFRYAAAPTPAALERVKLVLAGVSRLFEVTTDAAVSRGTRVPVSAGPGILARTARPSTDPVNYTAGEANDPMAGPLENRPCHYADPEGGWTFAGQTYRSYAAVPPTIRLNRILASQVQPVGRVWYGWGCGDNHPVSRDQYVGVMMGLAYAYQLVPDAAIHAEVGRLIDQALDYLILRGKWNIRLPPDNRIETNFMGDFPKQLFFLRLGKTVNPAKYGSLYDDVAPAAELAWIPVWFSAVDPVFQYYKFNLTHAAFAPALLLETDPALRSAWTRSYNVLWRAIGHHRNAYFDLLRILVQSPSQRAATAGERSRSNSAITLAEEIKVVLGEWLQRRNLVKGPNGLPLNKVADPDPQIALWPSNIARFQTLEGVARCLARYPLPVQGRHGVGMDFVWQRHPFSITVDAGCSSRQVPTREQILAYAPAHARREGPAVDYLLAFWLGRYLGVLPAPAVAPPPPPPPAPPPPPPAEPPPTPPPPSEGLTLSVTRFVKAPVRPKAGKRFTARIEVRRSDTTGLLAIATVSCSGRAAKRAARVVARSFKEGTATCAWSVPRKTRGKLFAASISVRTGTAVVVKRFSARIR